MSIIDDVLAVIGEGYRPYYGKVSEQGKKQVKCENWDSTFWFVKETDRRRVFMCLGCESRPCVLANPEGFELTMQVPVNSTKISFMEARAVSPEELFRHKKWFRAEEAAKLLAVSTRKIRYLVEEGALVRHKDKPFRITAKSLEAQYNREEDW
ncbi:MAG: helix-turn-helix domain-containing protein [Desulfovibrio sp.]|uniref:helix-turn-helix domain-containing protein n=1 Tax=Desulfovibrio sp. 7SRBS1 TaxID=3378064 RepID=UPI003B3C4DC3